MHMFRVLGGERQTADDFSVTLTVTFLLHVGRAPIIALYADLSTPVPIYVSGALFVVAGFIALLLPFEPRGKASI